MKSNVIEMLAQERICNKCKTVKPLSEFSADKTGTMGRTSRCKPCRNEDCRKIYKENPKTRRSGLKNRPDKLKRLYGVTYEHVVRTLVKQHGRCDNRACGKEISLDVKGPVKNRAVIDHDHKTGKFRALLCTHCNMLLGAIETQENLINGLVDYLDKFIVL